MLFSWGKVVEGVGGRETNKESPKNSQYDLEHFKGK